VSIPRFRNISIKRKMTLIIMLTTSIALLLSCVAMITYDWFLSKQSLTRRIDTLAEIIGQNSTAALIFDDPGNAAEILEALRTESHVVSASIYTDDGSLFAKYYRNPPGFSPDRPEPDGYRFDENHLLLFRSILLDGDRIGAIFIQTDLKEMQDRLQRYVGIVVLFVLISSLVAFLVGSRLRDLISTPILRLTDTMREVSEEKNYSARAEKQSDDEIGVLIDGFNAMLTQIQDRDAALQQARDELALRAQELQIELLERERIEAQIKASLQEKEVLLKEIHHRVKNNLQVISSLLDLQANHIHDERTIEMFRDSQNRVSSMGLIHERLYQAEDLARIDFADYIRDLANNLFYSYSVDAAYVTLATHVDDVVLDVDRGIPCGLIINELVSNSLKYAFPNGQKGEIHIDLHHRDEQFLLVVRDDGVGIPDGIDLQHTPSLGLKLVNTLVRQLKGKIALERKNGTKFTIEFSV
jgi:two-component sensor histidine kinase